MIQTPPKDETFKTITCEKLIVKQFVGTHRVEFLCNHKGGDINVYNNVNQIVACIGIDANDCTGMVETYYPTGNGAADEPQTHQERQRGSTSVQVLN